jgi:outer membrane protein assembly factor BamB
MSRWVLFVVAVLVPPLGIVLLWTRTRAGIFRKLAGSIVLVLLNLVHLYLFFGLRAEFDGTGTRPIFSFETDESHYEELERSRSEQKVETGTPGPAPAAEPVEPREMAEPSVSPEAVEPAERAENVTGTPESPLDWPRFRGPAMDGRYEGEILTAWPAEGLPRIFRQPVGGGYASFVIAGGRAFTIEQRREREVVAAYDLATGREIWTRAWTAEFRETLGGDGPRATPTWDEGVVYTLGAEGNLAALDEASGEVFWERNILEDAGARNLTWGMAASPLVVDEKLVVLPGGSDGSSVVAYDKRTGAVLWKSLDDRQAYTSPMLVTLAGERQILAVGERRALGLAVEDGSLLWDHPWVTNQGINVAQPLLLGGNRIFLSAGYGHGAEAVEVNADESGFRARSLWSNTRMKNKFTSSVLHEGFVYGLDEAILACIDPSTGELKWKGGRYGYGQIVLASGHLIVLTERGELALVEATPDKHVELARFQAIEGKTWNHPAIADGILLVRNADEMAAFRIAP